MFPAALVAALAILLVQGSEARVEDGQSITERANELREQYIRDVEDKSSKESASSKEKDEARRQKVQNDGFLATVWDDMKYTILTPIYWLFNLIFFPIHVLQNAYYAYTLKDEKTE